GGVRRAGASRNPDQGDAQQPRWPSGAAGPMDRMVTEADPRRGWLQRLTAGLSKSSKVMTEQVVLAFAAKPLDAARLIELEETLIEADLGPAAAAKIAHVIGELRFGRSPTPDEVKEALA